MLSKADSTWSRSPILPLLRALRHCRQADFHIIGPDIWENQDTVALLEGHLLQGPSSTEKHCKAHLCFHNQFGQTIWQSHPGREANTQRSVLEHFLCTEKLSNSYTCTCPHWALEVTVTAVVMGAATISIFKQMCKQSSIPWSTSRVGWKVLRE